MKSIHELKDLASMLITGALLSLLVTISFSCSKVSEINMDKVKRSSTTRLSPPIKITWNHETNMVIQVYKQGKLIFDEEHSSGYIIQKLPPGRVEIKIWIPESATAYKDSVWVEVTE